MQALHSCAGAATKGVFAASTSGPGGNRGAMGQLNDGTVTRVMDQNGNLQTFGNGEHAATGRLYTIESW